MQAREYEENDEYEGNEESRVNREDIEETQQRITKFRLSVSKPNERFLSCMIQSNEKATESTYHLKTESIDKLIADRKIRPINKLKVGSKNIKFSNKNKEELSRDLFEFITKKNNQNCENPQPKQLKNTVVIDRITEN